MRRELDSTHCQKMIFDEGSYSGHQCTKKPVVTRDGKLYCRIHDPEYIAEKSRKWQAKWDEEWAEKQKRWTLDDARAKTTEGLTLKELQQVTPEMIRTLLTREEV